MSVLDRVKILCKNLVIKGNARNQKELGVLLGYKNESSFSQILNGKVPLPGNLIEKLISLDENINSHWIETGNGAMYINKNSNALEINVDMFQNIPLVPVRAHAGYKSGFGDAEYIESLPTVPVIVDRSYKGKYRCFEIDGDSMDDGSRDSICDKDVVLCREVKRDLWCNKLHIKDWNFILVTKDGILAKRIISHDIITCKVICHSLNPMYEDFEICLNDVYELYNIIKIVDRNARI